MPKAQSGDMSEPLPTLVLDRFTKAPWVEFEECTVGEEKANALRIHNPGERSRSISLRRRPVSQRNNDFFVNLDDMLIPPSSSRDIEIKWTPQAPGIQRELLLFALDERHTVQAILYGMARESCVERRTPKPLTELNRKVEVPDSKRKHKKYVPRVLKLENETTKFEKKSLCAEKENKENKAPSPVKPRRQQPNNAKALSFKGRSQQPYMDMSYFHGEGWLKKQDAAFTAWLNFILRDAKKDVSEKTESLSNDDLKTKARKLLQTIYKTDKELIRGMVKVEQNIDNNKISFAEGLSVSGDVGFRERSVKILGSYNSFWLVLGLEIVLKKTLPQVESQNLSQYIETILYEEILTDKGVAAAFSTNSTVDGLYRPGFELANGKTMMKKILLLVFLLDKAKFVADSELRGVLGVVCSPLLFKSDSHIKSSNQLLRDFVSQNGVLRSCLKGEGDIVRHLSFLGYTLNYEQTPVSEFDFSVKDIAVDLRDGLRICKLIDILRSGNNTFHPDDEPPLIQMTKSPASSRASKLHNLNLALRWLERAGLSLEFQGDYDLGANPANAREKAKAAILAADIVDGKRIKTMELLWRILKNWQLPSLINEEELNVEINILENTLESRYYTIVPVSTPSCTDTDLDSSLHLLLKWTRLVNLRYGKTIEDFCDSFADGRALCFLVHYYVPRLVRYNSIQACPRDSSLEELTRVSSHNFELVEAATRQLGGIPCMIGRTYFSDGIPCEKVILIYITFLSSRLLEIGRESRAARRIQRWWRAVLQKQHGLKKNIAAIKIQRQIRVRLARVHFARSTLWENAWVMRDRFRLLKAVRAVVKIQTAFRHWASSRALIREKSAILIQRSVRQYLEKVRYIYTSVVPRILDAANRRIAARKRFVLARRLEPYVLKYISRKRTLRRESAASKIQSHWLKYKYMVKYQQLRESVIAIQEAVIEKLAESRAVIVIQKHWRGHCVRQTFESICRQNRAACKIQASFRGFRSWVRYMELKYATIIIQREFRGWRERLSFWPKAKEAISKQRDRITRVQAQVRGYRVRKALKEQNRSATVIQSFFRAWRCRKAFLSMRKHVIEVQRQWRGYTTNRRFQEMKLAAVCIQKCFKRHISRRDYKTLLFSIKRVQALYRGRKVRRTLEQQRASALTIQRVYRGYRQRLDLLGTLRSTVLIQRAYRSYVCRKAHHLQMSAATRIQCTYRMFRARVKYSCKLESIVKIQSLVRGHSTRLKIRALRESVHSIQTCFKMQRLRRRLVTRRSACMKIQKNFRMWFDRSRFTQKRRATVTIQKYWRRYVSNIQREKVEFSVQFIQAARKRYQAMRRMKTIKKRHESARLIQLCFQRYRARVENEREVRACVVIQSWWKSCTEMRRYRLMVCSAVLIQKTFRMAYQRRIFMEMRRSSITISSYWKRYSAQRKYDHIRHKVIKLQAYYKGRHAREEYTSTRQQVCLIQSLFRRNMAQLHLKRLSKIAVDKERRYQAVQTIQRYYCGHLCHKAFLRLRCSAIFIQRHWLLFKLGKCGGLAQKMSLLSRVESVKRYCNSVTAPSKLPVVERAEFVTLRSAAVVIQSYHRMNLAKRLSSRRRMAVCLIQSAIKMKLKRLRIQKMSQAATRIARQWRTYRQSRIQIEAAVTIQAGVRRWFEQSKYQVTRTAALRLQSFVKMHQCRTRYHNLRARCVSIQQAYRRHSLKKRIADRSERIRMHLENNAVKIQSCVRGWLDRRRSKLKSKMALKIQNAWRRHTERQSMAKKTSAALLIQSAWRFSRAKRIFRALTARHNAATVVQSHYRTYIARKRQAIALVHRKSAVTLIQTVLRTKAARENISYLHTRKRSSVLIQAAFRAFLERKKCSLDVTTKFRLAAIRIRLRELYRNMDPTMTLQNVNERAFRVLRKSRELSQVLRACQSIHGATRYSKYCCKRVATGGGIPILFRFIRSCNRSTPHIELLKYALQIFRNICRHSCLLSRVAEHPESVNILVEQLQMYRDKDVVFMPALDTVLFICSNKSHLLKVSKMNDLIRRLKSMSGIIERRLEMERHYQSRGRRPTPSEQKKMETLMEQSQSLYRLLEKVAAVEL